MEGGGEGRHGQVIYKGHCRIGFGCLSYSGSHYCPIKGAVCPTAKAVCPNKGWLFCPL